MTITLKIGYIAAVGMASLATLVHSIDKSVKIQRENPEISQLTAEYTVASAAAQNMKRAADHLHAAYRVLAQGPEGTNFTSYDNARSNISASNELLYRTRVEVDRPGSSRKLPRINDLVKNVWGAPSFALDSYNMAAPANSQKMQASIRVATELSAQAQAIRDNIYSQFGPQLEKYATARAYGLLAFLGLVASAATGVQMYSNRKKN